MKNLYEECKQKEFNEQKTRIELDEKAKAIAAVDATESEWKNSKKEESLLLNKVKYNAHLETKLLENNQLLKQHDEMIAGLKQQVHIHKTKIIDLKEIIRKQDLELENLKEERGFLKKFKEKYLEVQAAKKKKKKEDIERLKKIQLELHSDFINVVKASRGSKLIEIGRASCRERV